MQTVQDARLDLDLRGSAPLYAQIAEQIQSLVAIGRLCPGQQLPTVRGLASELRINPGTVGRAYAELERAGVITTHRGGGSYVAAGSENDHLAAMRQDRLRAIMGKAAMEALSLGYSPQDIAAEFTLHMARWEHASKRPRAAEPSAGQAVDPNTILLTGSHDLILDMLASHLRRRYSHLNLRVTNIGSLGGLIALQREEAHVAGAHLLDEETGEFNVPFVKRLLPGQDVVLVTLVHRFQGLIVAAGNPKGIMQLSDLRRPEVRFINRQRGSGTRVLVEHMMRKARMASREVRGYDREVDTHIAVAAAIASGSADVGLGIYAAARSFGLTFVGLVKERFDLVIPRHHFDSRNIQSLLETLRNEDFKRAVDALDGCDAGETGRLVALPSARPNLEV